MKYIKIQIVGHEAIIAYENSEKESDKHPDYVASGVAEWINRDGDGRNGKRQNGASRPYRRNAFDEDDDDRPALREPAFAA